MTSTTKSKTLVAIFLLISTSGIILYSFTIFEVSLTQVQIVQLPDPVTVNFTTTTRTTTTTTTTKKPSRQKLILFWTGFYTPANLQRFCVDENTTLARCQFKNCVFSFDKNDIRKADAVVFHGRNLEGSHKIAGFQGSYLKLPSYRSPDQLWIFYMLESPIYTWVNLKPFNNLFNLTMTYRLDSDIYAPYGQFLPLQPDEEPLKPVDFKSKKSLVAWTATNCALHQSERQQVASELQKHMKVDVYGKCGTYNCTAFVSVCASPLECHEFLGKKYKFYLAFENSLCEDYITEKFFDALYAGMVPVVYGYGDYARVAPKWSYIDATAFPSVKALADYLKYLDKNVEEYKKYFKWREDWKIDPDTFQIAWCGLCTKLWSLDKAESSQANVTKRYQVADLNSWWNSRSGSTRINSRSVISNKVCVEPKEFHNL